MTNIIPKMLTIAEAAKNTGLAAYYIRQLCLSEKIVYVNAGKKYLVNLDKLIEYLNTGDVRKETNTRQLLQKNM